MMGRWWLRSTNWHLISLKENKLGGKKGKWLSFFHHNAAMVVSWFTGFAVVSCLLETSLRPQDLSDVRAQSKEADSTLQMDWACSCSDRWPKKNKKNPSIYWQDGLIFKYAKSSKVFFILYYVTLTELLHWYTQMLHSSCFASVVLSARRFFPAPRPSS